MFDATFLSTLKNLIQPGAVTVDGKSYSTSPLHNLPLPTEPPFPSVKLATLDSLVDYIKQNRDKEPIETDAQIICAAQFVDLVSSPRGENRRRDGLATVTCGRRSAEINKYLDMENFRLQLLTQYAESPEQRSVLTFISKITDSNVMTSEDDGVTQTVTAKVGVATHATVDIPSPIRLQPIRTFEEIDQPEGEFVFRMQKGPKGLEAGLFEIDTNWQRKAAIAVREYLKAKLPEMTVLA